MKIPQMKILSIKIHQCSVPPQQVFKKPLQRKIGKTENYDDIMLDNYKKYVDDRFLSIEYDEQLKSMSFMNKLDINILKLSDCCNIDLSTVPSNLQELELKFCKIKSLNILPFSLTILYLSYNKLVDVYSLQTLTNLEFLSLFNNLIIDISPLKKLVKLSYLDLCYNKITDFTHINNHPNRLSYKTEGQKKPSKKELSQMRRIQAIRSSQQMIACLNHKYQQINEKLNIVNFNITFMLTETTSQLMILIEKAVHSFSISQSEIFQ
ncbi:putative_Phosphoprotein phosphatase [Hexamita inflata]|uniref:Putative_Phosphoprotein phosphatase n=1 Tax=Hexamita inflata TaxID=28002 RepID=A0ABP1GWN5_9EUKA